MILEKELILVIKCTDFKKKIRSFFVCSLSKLGIDPLLSARIEREEKEAITTPAIAAPRSINSTENTGLLSIKILRNLNRI
jgi:hypothetical protein